MNTNIIFKSILNGILAVVLFALFQTLVHHVSFTVSLMAMSNWITGICCMVGSYIGYNIQLNRRANKFN